MGLGTIANITGLEPTSSASAATLVPSTALANNDSIYQARGTAWSYAGAVVDPVTEAPITGTFTPETPLRAFVWDGVASVALATPSVAWLDTAAGTFTLTLMPADLAGLDAQPYPLRVEVEYGGQWADAADFWLDVLPEVAATAPAALPVYASYQDLLDVAGVAIRQLLTPEAGAGFVKMRAKAREYLDRVIIARYRPPGGAWGMFGYGTGYLGAWNSLDTPNPIIKQYLAANYLVVTDQVVEIVSRKALALIYDRQEDAAFRKLARAEHTRADWGIAALAAQLDINGDGYADITINCGTFSARDI